MCNTPQKLCSVFTLGYKGEVHPHQGNTSQAFVDTPKTTGGGERGGGGGGAKGACSTGTAMRSLSQAPSRHHMKKLSGLSYNAGVTAGGKQQVQQVAAVAY